MIEISNQFSESEMLKYAIESGILDMTLLQNKMEMLKRKELLEKHTYKIWQGKDGNWFTYLPDKERGRVLRKRKTRESIEDDVVEYWREELENPTVEEVFKEWVSYKLDMKEISNSTYDRYNVDFNKYFVDFGKRRIKSIEENDIEEFLMRQVAEYELTAKGYANVRTLVYGIFKRAKKKKYVSFSVTQLVNDIEISRNTFKKVVKEDYEEVFSEEEKERVWKVLASDMDMANLGIMLTFVTGLRVGELVSLKSSDVSDNVVKVRRTETRYYDKELGKSVFGIKEHPKSDAGVRDVVVPKDYEYIIKEIKKRNPFGEYLMMKNGTRMHTYTIRKRLYNVCEKANVYQKSPHKIRKTYGSILLDNHVDNLMIIQQMGHSDILCTEQHYHRNRRNYDQKSVILSAIPEFIAK